MIKIASQLAHINTVAIAGHVRPDGDCIGSCMGLYLYIKENYPGIKADIYLEKPREGFSFIEGFDEIKTECSEGLEYDLFITLDASTADRIGVAMPCFSKAQKRLCIDHHISNTGFGDVNVIHPEVGSTGEILYEMLEETRISKSVAEALYMAIAHDTGVFQYEATTSRTMEIAGKLMDMGIPFSKILEESYFSKSYVQNQILGRCLVESMLILDKTCIVSYVKQKDLDFYNVTPKDLDGVINQLRKTRGAEVAIFLYEAGNQEYKVSMRSKESVDVQEVAAYFQGGGHVRAAGCTMHGSIDDVINNLTCQIEKQL